MRRSNHLKLRPVDCSAREEMQRICRKKISERGQPVRYSRRGRAFRAAHTEVNANAEERKMKKRKKKDKSSTSKPNRRQTITQNHKKKYTGPAITNEIILGFEKQDYSSRIVSIIELNDSARGAKGEKTRSDRVHSMGHASRLSGRMRRAASIQPRMPAPIARTVNPEGREKSREQWKGSWITSTTEWPGF